MGFNVNSCLRNFDIPNEEFYDQASILKNKDKEYVILPANNQGIISIQQKFIYNDHKMYRWADNNQSERKLRYLLITRRSVLEVAQTKAQSPVKY